MTTGYYTPYDSFYLTIWFILHENTTYVYTIYICTHTYPHIPDIPKYLWLVGFEKI